jgi:hypothetical protein
VRITESEPYFNYQANSDLAIDWRAAQIYNTQEGNKYRVGNVIGFRLADLRSAGSAAKYSIEFSHERAYDYLLLDGYGLATYIAPMVFISMQLADDFEVTPEGGASRYLTNTTKLYSSTFPGLSLIQFADTVPTFGPQVPAAATSEALVFELDAINPENSSYYDFPNPPPVPVFVFPPNTPRAWIVRRTVYLPSAPLDPPPP